MKEECSNFGEVENIYVDAKKSAKVVNIYVLFKDLVSGVEVLYQQ